MQNYKHNKDNSATEFEFKGVKYIAKDAETLSCDDCAMEQHENLFACLSAPLCSNHERADHRNIIWIKKEDAK